MVLDQSVFITTIENTLRGKHKLENFAKSTGVDIKSYKAYTQIFSSKEYLEDYGAQGQDIDFCGVGAYHMNGVLERSIQKVVNLARTLTIDMSVHWPDQTVLEMWPMSMDHAV